MKIGINTETRTLKSANLESKVKHVCPGCGGFLYVRSGRNGKEPYFVHARGRKGGCDHNDLKLLIAIILCLPFFNVRLLKGWKIYAARVKQNAIEMAELARQLDEPFSGSASLIQQLELSL